MLKYQSNVTSISESRRKMGYKDSPDDEEKLYKNYIDTKARMKEIDRTAEHQKEIAKMSIQSRNANNSGSASKGSTANKSPRSSKSSSPNKAVDNNNRPANQHGKTSAKIKEAFNSEYNKKVYTKEIYSIYMDACDDIMNGEDSDLILPLTAETISTLLERIVDMNSNQGMVDALKDINTNVKKVSMPKEKIVLTKFYEEFSNDLKHIFKNIVKELDKEDADVEQAFNKYEYKVRFLEDYYARKSYWYSYVKTGAFVGIDKAYIKFSSDKDANENKDVIDTKAFTVEEIPAYHSFCNCEITYTKPKAGEKA